MSEWLASIAPAVANHLWQSSVFAVASTLLTVLLRNNQARVRYWIWLVALMKFLLPFSLLVGLGGLASKPHYAPVAMPTTYAALDTMSEPFAVGSSRINPIEITRTTEHRVSEAVALAWFCGLVVTSVMWWLRWRRVAALVRQGSETDARVVDTLRRLERDAGVRPVQFVVSQCSMEPGMFGVFHPVLLWPKGISARLSDAQIEAILAHEVCHVRRRDNLFAMAQMVVETVFWFYPLVWWMGTRMVEERERACDEAVLGQGRSPEIYAESILKICEFCLESAPLCVSGISGADLTRRIVRIMGRQFGQKLSIGKRIILATAGVATVAVPVAFGVVGIIPLYAQILHATGPLPSYEVATIKPEGGERVVGSLPGNMRRFNGTAKDLIEGAYNVPYRADERVIGGPTWITSNHYVIEGKIPDDIFAKMQTMSGIESRMQNSLMKQSLLADRFKLKVHFEMRELPVYALVVEKGGSKVKPTNADPNTPPVPKSGYYMNTFGPNNGVSVTRTPQSVLEMTVKGMNMDYLAQSLEEVVADIGGRTIVNRTGLDGQYDFALKWTPEQTADAPSPDSAATNAPSIFTALKEQLGLKLVPAKGMVEVVVIDGIEQPSGN
jgi:uncharacterized protein (TIGR03435 family)